MHDNLHKVAAHNMAGSARSSARLTDALAATNEREHPSRDLEQQPPPPKARVCRYFSKSGIWKIFPSAIF
jgi:hypothetical protein